MGRTGTLPPDTKAFLYYYTSPETPRIAGELRLRVIPSDGPASFESGSDLGFKGQIWSRSLYVLSKYYIPLYEKLREEGYVPDDLNAVLSTFPPGLPRSQPLYTINDTFIIDFSNYARIFTIITEQGVGSLRFYGVLRDYGYSRPPYTGAYTNHYIPILLD